MALVLGINGYLTVGDELSKEQIVGGSDMAPAEIQKAASEAGLPATIKLPSCDVVSKTLKRSKRTTETSRCDYRCRADLSPYPSPKGGAANQRER